MSLTALSCVPLGHRWRTDPDSTEVYPLRRCERCGSRQSGPAGCPGAPAATAAPTE